MSRRRLVLSNLPEPSVVARARRAVDKGDVRRAVRMLRDACHANSESAPLYVHYALACARAGKTSDAEDALRHAVWLRRRDRDPRRAASTAALADHLRARPTAHVA